MRRTAWGGIVPAFGVVALGVLALGVLALALTGCGGTDDVEDPGGMSPASHLSGAQKDLDERTAELVPALAESFGADATVWRGEFRACSEPDVSQVAYHVKVQFQGGPHPLKETTRVLDRNGWSELDSNGEHTVSGTDGDLEVAVLAAPYATDVDVKTACFDVGEAAGSDFVGRRPVDFLER